MRKVYPKTMENASGHWAYIDDQQFYIETREYEDDVKAIAALKKILNPHRFEIVGTEETNESPIKEQENDHMETTQEHRQDKVQPRKEPGSIMDQAS